MKPYQLLFWCLQRKLNISNTKSWGRQKLQWRTAVLCHSTVPSQKVVNDSGEWLNDTTGMKKKERKKEKKKDPTLLTHWRENVGALSKNVKARPFSIDRCRTSIWFFLQTWQGLPSCRANEMLSERGGGILWGFMGYNSINYQLSVCKGDSAICAAVAICYWTACLAEVKRCPTKPVLCTQKILTMAAP